MRVGGEQQCVGGVGYGCRLIGSMTVQDPQEAINEAAVRALSCMVYRGSETPTSSYTPLSALQFLLQSSNGWNVENSYLTVPVHTHTHTLISTLHYACCYDAI